jgi:signal transduction histidine kinase
MSGNEHPSIGFPDLPRSELERAIGELVDRAQDVLTTQGRLRNLLRATSAIAEDLDLPVVLERIAQAAVDLVGSDYGALGVIGSAGQLEQFIHVGISPERAKEIGNLPQGRGVLGALITSPHPVRLEQLADDPRSSGFPDHHPRMDGFLGVPIRVRGEAYGNLYLTNSASGGFSSEDEELLIALAASAGVAIDNARLFGETQRRQRWATASAEVSAALLDEEGPDPLRLVANAIMELSDASLVAVVSVTNVGALAVEDAWGADAAAFNGRVFPYDGSLSGRVIESGNPALSPGLLYPDPPAAELFTGPAMGVPLLGAGGRGTTLVVARPPGSPQFTDSDLDMTSEFAGHASVALELRQARLIRARLALLEDRSRIARDLHDNVIQRLFGAGLALNALDLAVLPGSAHAKVEAVSVLLDEAIAEIRKSVFALSSTDRSRRSARHRLLEVVSESASSFPVPPRVTLDGQLDELATPALLDDLEAVIREGLSNSARHAEASSASVTVHADGDTISVRITDDGRGLGLVTRASGTRNLAARAEAWGGSSRLSDGDDGGAILQWAVPTPAPEGAAP